MSDAATGKTQGVILTQALASAGVFVMAAVLWAAPASLSPSRCVPDAGDPLHLAWVMAWDAHQLAQRPWALYDSNGFYPYPHSLAFGDHLLPEALAVAPVFWASGNAVLASNVAVLLALVLSALAMFLLVYRTTSSTLAAFLAGLYYAFNTFTRSELARVQVLNVQWWPLALLFIVRFARQGRGRDAMLGCLCLLLQGLSGTYYLVFTVILAPLWLLVAWVASRRQPGRSDLLRAGGSATAAAAIGLAMLWPYIGHFRTLGFEKPLGNGVDATCYLAPPPDSPLGLAAAPGDRCLGATHFLGFAGTALMVAGAILVLARRVPADAAVVGAMAVTTCLAGLLLSLGPIVRVAGRPLFRGPYDVLYSIFPPVRGMDGPQRTVALVLLGGAILLGIALAYLLGRLPRPARTVAAVGLALLLPLEHWSTPSPGVLVPTGRDVPPVYRWLADESTPVIELPVYPEVAKRYWALYLYFSTYHWRPIPIGRTSFYPPAHAAMIWNLREFPDETSLKVLERLGIHTVVVHPLIWPEAERPSRLRALEREPRLEVVRTFPNETDTRFAALDLGHERVFRIRPAASSSPARLCNPMGELPRTSWALRAGTGTGNPPVPAFVARSAARPGAVAWATELATDGDRRTAFRTDEPQRPGDYLEVVLPGSAPVAAATIDQWYPYDEFPRNLVVVAYGGGRERRRLVLADGPEERWATIEELVRKPREARIVLRFAPQEIRRLVLRLGEGADLAWPAWSIPELRLYERCE